MLDFYRKHTAAFWGSVIIFIGLIYALRWIIIIVHNITLPQLEYSEGLMMYNSWQFAQGLFSWHIAPAPPYMVSFYPPIFYWIMGGLLNIFGNNIVVGRIFVLICTCISMALIGLIVYQITKNKWIGVGSALLPLTQPIFMGWSFLMRVDIPSVMFELAGIYLVARFWQTKGYWIFLAIIPFALAFFTKQMIAAGALATCLAILFVDRRRGLLWGAAMGAAIALPLAIGSALTGGGLFTELVLYTRTSPFYKTGGEVLQMILIGYAYMAPLVVLSIVYFLNNTKNPFSLFFVIALGINLFLIGRVGGSANYQMEIICASSLVAGLMFMEILRLKIEILMAILILPVMALLSNNAGWYFPDSGYVARYNHVKELIKDADYPIMSENFSVVVDAGKQFYYEPFVFTMLSDLNYWDGQKAVGDLESKRIPYVISEHILPYEAQQRYSPEVSQAVVQNYHIIYEGYGDGPLFNMVVYAPNK